MWGHLHIISDTVTAFTPTYFDRIRNDFITFFGLKERNVCLGYIYDKNRIMEATSGNIALGNNKNNKRTPDI